MNITLYGKRKSAIKKNKKRIKKKERKPGICD